MSREQRDSHFDAFEGHTLLKHGVLDRYVKAWLQILGSRYETLWIVDGFAGPGQDLEGNPGSPLLFARSAAELQRKGITVRLFAVEIRGDYFAELKRTLAPFDAEAGGADPVAFLRWGTLASHVEEAFRQIGRSPAFFFLDPFGADGLSLDVVRQALTLPKGEVFALFSPRAIYRHLSVLAAEDHVDRARRASSETLFADIDQAWLADELKAAEESDSSLLPTQAAAERILVDLFGSKADVDRILAVPKAAWLTEVLQAYVRILRDSTATHMTPIAVFDEDQHQAYYLIHAAKHPKATVKMKEALQAAVNKSELPDRTKRVMRVAHAVPISRVLELVRDRFAGQDVFWTDKPKSEGTVQGYALAGTPMMCDQAAQLKAELGEHYVLERKPLRFRFPPHAN